MAHGTPPPTAETTDADRLAADREFAALERALDSAERLRGDRDRPVYVLWHFPPFDAHGRPAPCVDRLERAGVSACVYGHLHNPSRWSVAVQGAVRGVRYHCVAADAVGFRPLRIDPSTQRSP